MVKSFTFEFRRFADLPVVRGNHLLIHFVVTVQILGHALVPESLIVLTETGGQGMWFSTGPRLPKVADFAQNLQKAEFRWVFWHGSAMSKNRRDVAMVTPIGRVVHDLRRLQGLTLDSLEAKVQALGGQVSKRKIQQLEKSLPARLSIVEAVAGALGVPVDALLFDVVEVAKTLIDELYVRQGPGAIQRLREIFDENIVMWISGNPKTIPFAGKYVGIAGGEAFFTRLFGVIAPRGADPPPFIANIVADYATGTVVVDLENDIVRRRDDPQKTLTCKVKCTFRFQGRKLVYFEDLFDTAAWEGFLSGL